jgi:hypothetical protein
MTGGTRKALPVTALYTAQSLADFAGVGRARFVRLLEAYGVATLEADGVLWVPLIEIERRLEPLWESIVVSARLRGRRVQTENDEF